jgi:hypothetical protein
MKPRSFGLTDALILVIAAAVGLSINRLNWAIFLACWSNPLDAHDSIEQFLGLVMPHVAAMTVATLAMRVRRPRPRFRRIARQSGLVACMVALAVLLIIASWVALTTLTGQIVKFSQHVVPMGQYDHRKRLAGYPSYPFSGQLLVACGDRIGFAVARAWLALLLVGRWQSESTWLDRLGRAIGCLWIALAAALWLRCYSV